MAVGQFLQHCRNGGRRSRMGHFARQRGHRRRLRQAAATGILPLVGLVPVVGARVVATRLATHTHRRMGAGPLYGTAGASAAAGIGRYPASAAPPGSCVTTLINRPYGASPPMAALISSRMRSHSASALAGHSLETRK